MISTAEVVESLVKASPLLEDGLSRGIISYSALAREIRPHIEKKLLKKVSRGAIVMGLKRVSLRLKQKRQVIQQTIAVSGLTVRSNLVELTYANSNTIAQKHQKIFILCERRKDVFWNLSQGVRETMLLVSEEVLEEVEKIFVNEKQIAKIEQLSSITVLLTKEAINVLGLYYSLLKLLAWNNISIVDVISTYSELTIIFANKDIDRAFSILRNYESFPLGKMD